MKNLTNIVRRMICVVPLMISGCVADPIFEHADNGGNGAPATRTQADGKYYYSFDEKIYLDEVSDKFVLRYDDNYATDVAQYLSKATPDKNIGFNQKEGIAVFATTGDLTTKTILEDLKSQKGIKSVSPVYRLSENIGPEMYFVDEFVVKFKDEVSQQQIDEIHKKYLVKVKEDPYQYLFEKTRQLLSVPADADVLEIANAYQESGLVVYSQPNFIAEVELNQSLPNDPYFNNQFYLRNTGQGVNGRTSTAGADINVVPAWNITKGNSNIVVAVIDEGVTSNHPDLPSTRQIRLSGSNFDSGNANDPSPTGNGNHGNACAGIIAASHNSEGIAGIVPNCKILPIRIPFGTINQTLLSKYAAAIRLAANNADIISNSWSFNTDNQNYSAEIVDAIRYATTSGKRGSKGSVVVFAAGNTANHVVGNNGYIAFPANVNISGVLTVGAIDRNGQQANYSPTSNPSSSQNQIIDVVAPSHKAYSSQISSETFDIWSIDIPGTAGYNYVHETDGGSLPIVGSYLPSSGTNYQSYTGYFGGTSAAAPQVAGVAALILSTNPDLYSQTVANIITSTTSLKGSQMGHGLVDAYEAVSKAAGLAFGISGSSFLQLNTNMTFSVRADRPAGTTFNGWSINPQTGYTVTGGTTGNTLNVRFNTKNRYFISASYTMPGGASFSTRHMVVFAPTIGSYYIPGTVLSHGQSVIFFVDTPYPISPGVSLMEWSASGNVFATGVTMMSVSFSPPFNSSSSNYSIRCRMREYTTGDWTDWSEPIVVTYQ